MSRHLRSGFRFIAETPGRPYEVGDALTKTALTELWLSATGVASGDPFTRSVILWTRVSPAPNAQNQAAAVDWAVSKTRSFDKKQIVSRGTTFTSKAVDFTIKVGHGFQMCCFERYEALQCGMAVAGC